MDGFLAGMPDWHVIWENDFNRGYVTGVTLVLLVIVAVLVLKIIFRLLFRVRRCREIVVKAPDGDILVAYDALNGAVCAALEDFAALNVRDMKLFRRRSDYFLELFCSYDASGEGHFPDEVKAVKERIFSVLKERFGIASVKRVRIRLENLTGLTGVPERRDETPVVLTPSAAAGLPPAPPWEK